MTVTVVGMHVSPSAVSVNRTVCTEVNVALRVDTTVVERMVVSSASEDPLAAMAEEEAISSSPADEDGLKGVTSGLYIRVVSYRSIISYNDDFVSTRTLGD